MATLAAILEADEVVRIGAREPGIKAILTNIRVMELVATFLSRFLLWIQLCQKNTDLLRWLLGRLAMSLRRPFFEEFP